jgi:hypothetical protein
MVLSRFYCEYGERRSIINVFIFNGLDFYQENGGKYQELLG